MIKEKLKKRDLFSSEEKNQELENRLKEAEEKAIPIPVVLQNQTTQTIHVEEEADKKEVLSLTDNISAASECKKDENLRNNALQPSDPDMKSEQERINPDIYSKHYEEARWEYFK